MTQTNQQLIASFKSEALNITQLWDLYSRSENVDECPRRLQSQSRMLRHGNRPTCNTSETFWQAILLDSTTGQMLVVDDLKWLRLSRWLPTTDSHSGGRFLWPKFCDPFFHRNFSPFSTLFLNFFNLFLTVPRLFGIVTWLSHMFVTAIKHHPICMGTLAYWLSVHSSSVCDQTYAHQT